MSNMIQAVMLVALGFLSAGLLSLLFSRAVWRRAVRLTKQRLRAELPTSWLDVQADRDQLRAEYAIKQRQLELALDKERARSARQMVEVNKQKANLKEHQDQIRALRASLAERASKTTVLEQTVRQKLPELMGRLETTSNELSERDQRIAKLRQAIEKQTAALNQAAQTERLRQAEIARLRQALDASTRNQGARAASLKEFRTVQAQNKRLSQAVEILKKELVTAKQFEVKQAPVLKQELIELGDRIIRAATTANGTTNGTSDSSRPSAAQLGALAAINKAQSAKQASHSTEPAPVTAASVASHTPATPPPASPQPVSASDPASSGPASDHVPHMPADKKPLEPAPQPAIARSPQNETTQQVAAADAVARPEKTAIPPVMPLNETAPADPILQQQASPEPHPEPEPESETRRPVEPAKPVAAAAIATNGTTADSAPALSADQEIDKEAHEAAKPLTLQERIRLAKARKSSGQNTASAANVSNGNGHDGVRNQKGTQATNEEASPHILPDSELTIASDAPDELAAVELFSPDMTTTAPAIPDVENQRAALSGADQPQSSSAPVVHKTQDTDITKPEPAPAQTESSEQPAVKKDAKAEAPVKKISLAERLRRVKQRQTSNKE